jgi:ATP-binding cassette, subfamily F, member 3
MKALARMEPVAAVTEDPSLRFDFPNPAELKPPLLTLDGASVGYEEGKPVLPAAQHSDRPQRPDRAARPQRQRQDDAGAPDGRAAAADGGEVRAPGKLRVGYFTQYQVEELDPSGHAAPAHDPG